MSPKTFEEQTECIVGALLADLLGQDEEIAFRSLETDSSDVSCAEFPKCGTADASSTFDPVMIASCLRSLGDSYTGDLEYSAQRVFAETVKGKVKEFGATVDSLSKSWSSLNPGLGYERAFLAVSVKLFMYLAQKAPAMVTQLQLVELINGNREVRGYIEDRGGWENFGTWW